MVSGSVRSRWCDSVCCVGVLVFVMGELKTGGGGGSSVGGGLGGGFAHGLGQCADLGWLVGVLLRPLGRRWARKSGEGGTWRVRGRLHSFDDGWERGRRWAVDHMGGGICRGTGAILDSLFQRQINATV